MLIIVKIIRFVETTSFLYILVDINKTVRENRKNSFLNLYLLTIIKNKEIKHNTK